MRIALIRNFAAAALVLCMAGAAHAGGIEQLRAFVDGTRSAKATFTQTVTAKSGRVPQQAAGTMLFSRPGKFRWVYEKPYAQLIVGDGEKLWIYDKDLNQVSVKKLGDALGSSPAALLAGDNAFEKNFTVTDGGSADGLEWVNAVPKQADSSFERLRIGFKDNLPRTMELRDNFGQVTLLNFTAMTRNPALDAAQFRFTPPAGADVVSE